MNIVVSGVLVDETRMHKRVSLLSQSEIMGRIDFTNDARKQFEKMVQDVAVQCVLLSHVDGNVDAAKCLLDKMKEGVSGLRYKALENYMLHFGAIRKDDKKNWKLDRQKRLPNIMRIDVAINKIIDTCWADFKHEDDGSVKAVRFEPVLKSILKFNKAASSGKFLEIGNQSIDEAIDHLNKLREVLQVRADAGL